MREGRMRKENSRIAVVDQGMRHFEIANDG